MSEFVEECRREWRRLRVPDAVADEMAADLSADLEEAEADGATREDVLGDAASDARGFAESWARERGLIQTRLSHMVPRRPILLTGAALVVFVVASGVALALVVSSDRSLSPKPDRHDARRGSGRSVRGGPRTEDGASSCGVRRIHCPRDTAQEQRTSS